MKASVKAFTVLVCIFTISLVTEPTLFLDHSLVHLLSLKDKNCGFIPWCTLAAKGNVTWQSPTAPCCTQCSCDTHCKIKNNCCPDYDLAQVLNTMDKPYSNFTDLLATLDAHPNITTILEDIVMKRKTENAINDGHQLQRTECLRAHIVTRQMTPCGQSYQMVSKCPVNYTQEVRTKILCERNPHEIENSTFDEFIPVSSVVTGMVYKNKYCLQCNEVQVETTLFAFWTIVVKCYGRFAFTSITYYRSPYELLQDTGLFKDGRWLCSFNFEPNETSIDKDNLKTCTVIDVKTCEPTTNKSDGMIDACTLYQAPVAIITPKYKKTFYNNIACFYCNEMTFSQECEIDRNIVRLEFNWPTETNTYVDQEVNRTQLDVLSLSFGDVNKKFVCDMGYVYDTFKNMCRKVICPRNMYAFNGTCVFLFNKVSGTQYSIWLNTSFSVKETIKVSKKLETVLYTTLEGVFRGNEHLSILRQSLWRNISVHNGVYLTKLYTNVMVIPRYSNATHLQIFDAMNSILRTTIQVQTKTLTFNVKLSLISNIMENRGTAVEMDNNNIIVRVLPKNEKPVGYRRTDLITVRRSYFCYRVCVNFTEVNVMVKGILVVLATEIVIYDDFQLMFKSDRLICICMHYVLGFYDNDLIGIPKVQKKKENVTQKENDIFISNLYLLIFGIVFILIVIAVYRINRFISKRCKNEEMQQQT